jgi:gamma-glutamylcyclotransferase (GGCT)/AIG2-like uncharacterized protein YtfP
MLVSKGERSLFPIVYRSALMMPPRKIFVLDSTDVKSGVAAPREYLAECEATLFPQYFSDKRAYVIPDGRWRSLSLFPLVNSVSLKDVRHIFAYGTLRPDDKSGAWWTAKFAEGMRWEPGYVRDVDLGMLEYPVVVIPSDPDQPHTGVHGCLVWADNDETFRAKLRDADGIEGCPKLYQRGVVMVHPTAETERDRVPAFIYYRTPVDIDRRPEIIASGDFCSGEPGTHRPRRGPDSLESL